MDTNKIKEIFSDQAFVKKLSEMETAAQVQAELLKKGIELSEQDVLSLRDDIVAHFKSGKDLSLDALDNVAGGLSIATNPVLSIVKNPIMETMKKLQQVTSTDPSIRW